MRDSPAADQNDPGRSASSQSSASSASGSSFEEFEAMLDPHREELQRRAADDITARLRQRGVDVEDTESLQEIGNLLEAVEQFEAEVELQGGDLFVNSGPATEPEDPAFVLPKRAADEGLGAYRRRVETAVRLLQGRRNR